MAIRQYVGARYVPRFTGLYDATQIYDALDVVDNGAGTSYIAKKTVPAGTPLTNTDFWFVYGASSGAILDLQNRMTTAENEIIGLDGRIDTLEGDRELVIVGDSWMAPLEGGAVIVPKITKTLNYKVSKVHNYAQGGTGFVRNYLRNFVEQLEDSIADASVNKSKVDTIICLGGTNDFGSATVAQFVTAINQMQTLVNDNYPNAKFYVFFMQGAKNRIYPYATIKAVIQGSLANVINMAWPIPFTLYTDNLHPTSIGYEEVARYISSNILGYSFQPISTLSSFTSEFNTAYGSGKWTALDANIRASWTEDSVEVFMYFQISINGSGAVPFGALTIPNLGIPVLFANSGNPIHFKVLSVGTNCCTVQLDSNTSILINGNDGSGINNPIVAAGNGSFIWAS